MEYLMFTAEFSAFAVIWVAWRKHAAKKRLEDDEWSSNTVAWLIGMKEDTQ